MFILLKNPFNILIIVSMVFSSCEEAEIAGNQETITCNAENITKNGNFVFSRKLSSNKFENSQTQSNKKARSGKFSSLLNKNRPFGMTYTVEHANEGDQFTIVAWRLGANPKGMIVASGLKDEFYVREGDSLGKDANGWEKLELKLTIPEGYKDIAFKVYCWNSGESPIYFDDLEINYQVNKEVFIQ